MRSRWYSRIAAVLLVAAIALGAWAAERTEVAFPDIGEYVTLKCDFHMHTIFSDGSVMPSIRVQEAWRNGLDAIAITDHVEYHPHKDYIDCADFNRSYNLAKPEADKMSLILIRGGEITRAEPHGHFNAIGVSDVNPLGNEDNREAVKAANAQSGFVWWNHPPKKDPEDAAWTEVQQEYLDKGWMHGIEVFNGGRYYPHSHRWCLEKGLTMMSNTDVHGLADSSFNTASGQCRPMTLVFAEARSEAATLDALRGRRTVCFAANQLVGEREWLEPLVTGAVEVLDADTTVRPKGHAFVGIHNACAASLELEANGSIDGISFPGTLNLPAGKTVQVKIAAAEGAAAREKAETLLPYTVKNALVAPGQGLPITLSIRLTVPAE